MTLYREVNGAFAVWAGEEINEVKHPLSIEQLWSAGDLAAIGLYAPAPADPVPQGKVIVSTDIRRVDGIVRYINTLGDEAPKPTYDISDRQFFQALAIRGAITEDEALDAVGPGIIPPAMDALIDQLPQDQRFAARMLIRGATRYERQHPIADLIRSLYGWSIEDADNFWRFAATL